MYNRAVKNDTGSGNPFRKQDKLIKKKVISALLTACILLVGGCSRGQEPSVPSIVTTATTSETTVTDAPLIHSNTPSLHVRPDVEPNGDIVILMTGDIHGSFDKGFSFGGVYEVRYQLELKGDTVLLVDDGDAIQGTPMAFNSKGEVMINIMNDLGYDVAIPGEHEFHYGMERFYEVVRKANFEYISCNFVKNGKQVLKPYTIKEVCGKKIAFVGITTPKALTLGPAEAFQDKDGNYIYGFMGDENGDAIVKAAQEAIDAAKALGADYVVLMGHIGNDPTAAPWTYDTITSRLKGYDVYLDGFSHDVATAEIMNADAKLVQRVPAGTRLDTIGWVRISAKDGSVKTGLYRWENDVDPGWLFDFENPLTKRVKEAKIEGKKYMQ